MDADRAVPVPRDLGVTDQQRLGRSMPALASTAANVSVSVSGVTSSARTSIAILAKSVPNIHPQHASDLWIAPDQ